MSVAVSTFSRRRLGLALSGLFLSTLCLSGCETVASLPIPFMDHPTELDLNVVGSPKLNPDVHKRPSPVVVRVYELKSRAQFDANDFITLYEHDKEVLGADVLARDEFVLRPGEAHPIARPANAETKFVAVLVGFRDLEKSHSRAVVAVVPKIKNRWLVTLDALDVAIVPALGK